MPNGEMTFDPPTTTSLHKLAVMSVLSYAEGIIAVLSSVSLLWMNAYSIHTLKKKNKLQQAECAPLLQNSVGSVSVCHKGRCVNWWNLFIDPVWSQEDL